MRLFDRHGMWRTAFWRGPWLELVLTALLFGTLAPQTFHLGPPAVTGLALVVLLVAAVTNALREAKAPFVLIAGMLFLALTVPFYSMLSVVLAMVSIFTLCSRGRTRLAVYAFCGYSAAGLITAFVAMQRSAWLIAPAVLACVLLLPFPLGMGLRAARLEADQILERTLRRQRREIANELHDYVTHDLSLLVMRAEQDTLTQGEDPDLSFMAATARRCNANARQLMGLLMSAEPETVTILQLTEAFANAEHRLRAHHFTVTVLAEDDATTLPPQAQTTLAKVVGEVTNNVIHHGDPAQPVTLIFTIEDAWASFAVLNTPLPHSRAGFGHGVPVMRHRIESFSGTFFSDRQGDQWITRIGIPITTMHSATAGVEETR